MIFTTVTFLVFFVIVFSLYWVKKSTTWQNSILSTFSYIFYGWWDWRFCALMFVSTLIDFILAQRIHTSKSRNKKRSYLGMSFIANLGLLGFFKYFNFFIENLQMVFESIGWGFNEPALNIILPVGISFYTFQTMSYSIDIFKGKLAPTKNLITYSSYVSFFPQLVAGPIERGSHLIPQFLKQREFNPSIAEDGLRQILWGLTKKMLVADRLGDIVNVYFFQYQDIPGPQFVIAVICFAFQIYCDFSAYSDMAIGLSKLFGIDLMRNFAYPYFSRNVVEFWRRWHISLSTWFRDYVYIPLGGSEGTRIMVTRNILITFIISGFWHGASWNFVIWGALNGLFMLPYSLGWIKADSLKKENVPVDGRLFPRASDLLKMFMTFSLICFTWIFFLSKDLNQSIDVVSSIFLNLFNWEAYSQFLAHFSEEKKFGRTLIYLSCFILIEWFQKDKHHGLDLPKWPEWLRWVLYTGLIWFIMSSGTKSTSQFIYFQF